MYGVTRNSVIAEAVQQGRYQEDIIHQLVVHPRQRRPYGILIKTQSSSDRSTVEREWKVDGRLHVKGERFEVSHEKHRVEKDTLGVDDVDPRL